MPSLTEVFIIVIFSSFIGYFSSKLTIYLELIQRNKMKKPNLIHKNLTHEEAIRKAIEILKGINLAETDSENGWWETSTGARFGKHKLSQILLLINSIYKAQS